MTADNDAPREWCLICHTWGHSREKHIPVPEPTRPIPPGEPHRRVRNPDSIDTCTGCDWEGWDTAPAFAEHVIPPEVGAS
jgi:hypothetical protein